MKEVCGNCTWFIPELETFVRSDSPAAIDNQIKNFKRRGALKGGSVGPPVYGKCRAVFQDDQNETQVYDFGTFSNSPCTARDSSGYKLFRVG